MPLELGVRLYERGIGAAQFLDETRLFRRRRHLVGHHAQETACVGGDGVRIGEVKRDGAEYGLARL